MKRKNFQRAKTFRRQGALARLEVTLKEFQEAKKHKEPWKSTRNGKPHEHSGRYYADECKRITQEINKLRERLTIAT